MNETKLKLRFDEKARLIAVDDKTELQFFRPMQLVLIGLASCSAIDISGILQKQKQVIDAFAISIIGRRGDGKPALWERVDLLFEIDGAINYGKAWRACNLSVEKYCSVAETLRRAGAVVRWDLCLNGEPLAKASIVKEERS